jgi:hypothetical protein
VLLCQGRYAGSIPVTPSKIPEHSSVVEQALHLHYIVIELFHMIKCKGCGDKFPTSVKIDGKWHVINKRKYCLICSPFGKHNTTNPLLRRKKGESVSCSSCGRVYEYDYKKGHRQKICNSCYVNRRRPLMKLRAIKHMGGSCIVCGYDKCPRSMHFHHLDPRKKDFAVGTDSTRSWGRIKRELKKCVLICANCHGEVHDGLIDLRQYVNGRRVG